jgi:hypothetical protein
VAVAVVAAAVAEDGAETRIERIEDMTMIIKKLIVPALLGAAIFGGGLSATVPAYALSDRLEAFIGAEPPEFATPEEGVAAFKAAMATGDIVQVSKLLGLDPEKVKAAEGIGDRIAELKEATAKLVTVEGEGKERIIDIGPDVWPFPFPLVKSDKDGKWAFDTVAGIEEIVNRRIGENEIHAIETARTYVEAQRDYAAEDRDGDGVLEYAQKLISTPGETDGLYWPVEQGDGVSPAGPNIDQAALDKAAKGDGYFGYKFRILRGQGNQVAGRRYDYVINGNMIGGFGLIAWPARYAETGVSTFVISHAGILYEKDLGPDTEKLVEQIRRFNPDASWELVNE